MAGTQSANPWSVSGEMHGGPFGRDQFREIPVPSDRRTSLQRHINGGLGMRKNSVRIVGHIAAGGHLGTGVAAQG